MSNNNNEMKKTLGLSTALATVVGSVIKILNITMQKSAFLALLHCILLIFCHYTIHFCYQGKPNSNNWW